MNKSWKVFTNTLIPHVNELKHKNQKKRIYKSLLKMFYLQLLKANESYISHKHNLQIIHSPIENIHNIGLKSILQSSIYFGPNALRHCCQRFFVNGKMKGDVEILKVKSNKNIIKRSNFSLSSMFYSNFNSKHKPSVGLINKSSKNITKCSIFTLSSMLSSKLNSITKLHLAVF